MKKIISSLVVLAGFFAQQKIWGKDTVTYEKNTKIDFEEKPIDGQFLTPEGSDVKGDKKLDFDTLLDPKQNFSQELKRDAGAVR